MRALTQLRLIHRFVQPVSQSLARRMRERVLFRKDRALRVALANDRARARDVLDEITEGYAALGLGPDLYLDMMVSLVLLAEQRWAEARARLEAIDPATIETDVDRATYERAMEQLTEATSVYRQ